MRPRSSSTGRNTSASVTVTVVVDFATRISSVKHKGYRTASSQARSYNYRRSSRVQQQQPRTATLCRPNYWSVNYTALMRPVESLVIACYKILHVILRIIGTLSYNKGQGRGRAGKGWVTPTSWFTIHRGVWYC